MEKFTFELTREEVDGLYSFFDLALKSGGLQNKSAVDKYIAIFQLPAPETPAVEE